MQAAKRNCNAPPPAIPIYGYVGGRQFLALCAGQMFWVNR